MKILKKLWVLCLAMMLVTSMSITVNAETNDNVKDVTVHSQLGYIGDQYPNAIKGNEWLLGIDASKVTVKLYYQLKNKDSVLKTSILKEDGIYKFSNLKVNEDYTLLISTSPRFTSKDHMMKYNLKAKQVKIKLDNKEIAYVNVLLPKGQTVNVETNNAYQYNNESYDLSGNKTLSVSYDNNEYQFVYKKHVADTKATALIQYVLQDGDKETTLKTDTLEVEKDKGNASYEVLKSFIVDNKEYVPGNDEAKTLTFNYYNSTLEYKIACKLKDENHYQVKVNYIDQDHQLISENSFDINDNDYNYYAPKSFSQMKNGEMNYYQTEEDTLIKHLATSDQREYTIQYTKFTPDSTTPYNWSIRLMDSQTGQQIKSIQKEVKSGSSQTYTPQESLEINDKKYQLDTNMKKEYTHTYGDSSRITYIWYIPEGFTPEESYDVTVQYVNIANGSTIHSEKVATKQNEDTTIQCPSSYEADDQKYVRLDGQSDTLTHSYYSPRRTYTVYYRNINDTINEHVIITEEEVVDSIRNITTYTYNDIPGQTITIVTNPTTGQRTVLAQDGTTIQPNTVPTTNGTNNNGNNQDNDGNDTNSTTIDDNQTPLAKSSSQNDQSKLLMIGGAALGLAIIFAIILFMKKHKKEQ